MSTYYATFTNWNKARSAANELLNGGVSPDDLSLVLCHPGTRNVPNGEIRDLSTSVGDASYFVGRDDDPERALNFSGRADITELTSLEESRISPIDTSNRDSDVDSVDQMEDSQAETETMISPRDGISHSAHESDDLALTVLTGFPTAPGNFSGDLADPFVQATQNTDALEIIDIPGVGLIIGGGSLATAALDLANNKSGTKSPCSAIVKQLTEDGVPPQEADDYQKHFSSGEALLAVTVTPGEFDELSVEEVAERNGAENGALFGVPRY